MGDVIQGLLTTVGTRRLLQLRESLRARGLVVNRKLAGGRGAKDQQGTPLAAGGGEGCKPGDGGLGRFGEGGAGHRRHRRRKCDRSHGEDGRDSACAQKYRRFRSLTARQSTKITDASQFRQIQFDSSKGAGPRE